jgi:hypothetical protein
MCQQNTGNFKIQLSQGLHCFIPSTFQDFSITFMNLLMSFGTLAMSKITKKAAVNNRMVKNANYDKAL